MHTVEQVDQSAGVAVDLELDVTYRCSVLQCLHIARDDDRSFVDDRHVLAEVLDEVELVGAEHHRLPGGGLLA